MSAGAHGGTHTIPLPSEMIMICCHLLLIVHIIIVYIFGAREAGPRPGGNAWRPAAAPWWPSGASRCHPCAGCCPRGRRACAALAQVMTDLGDGRMGLGMAG